MFYPGFLGLSIKCSDVENHTDPRYSCAIVFTRLPEILVCLRLKNQHQPVYAFFDSHSRPDHTEGAAFIFFTSLEDAAKYISELLHVDDQPETLLLADTSVHVFQTGTRDFDNIDDAVQILLQANFELLRLKVEGETAKTQCNAVATDDGGLRERLEALEVDMRALRNQTKLASKETKTTYDYKGKGKGLTPYRESLTARELPDPSHSGGRLGEKQKEIEFNTDNTIRAQTNGPKEAHRTNPQTMPTPKPGKAALAAEGTYSASTTTTNSQYSDPVKGQELSSVETSDEGLAYREQIKVAVEESFRGPRCTTKDIQGGELPIADGLRVTAQDEQDAQANKTLSRRRSYYNVGCNDGSKLNMPYAAPVRRLSALGGPHTVYDTGMVTTRAQHSYAAKGRQGLNKAMDEELAYREQIKLAVEESIRPEYDVQGTQNTEQTDSELAYQLQLKFIEEDREQGPGVPTLGQEPT